MAWTAIRMMRGALRAVSSAQTLLRSCDGRRCHFRRPLQRLSSLSLCPLGCLTQGLLVLPLCLLQCHQTLMHHCIIIAGPRLIYYCTDRRVSQDQQGSHCTLL